MKKTDFLIIGSGIAGLSFALKAAAYGKVCIITKANEEESNTKYAQGGVAVVIDKADSYANHINDTLVAGDGLCNQAIVEMVVKQGPERIQEIIDYGINFDKINYIHTERNPLCVKVKDKKISIIIDKKFEEAFVRLSDA